MGNDGVMKCKGEAVSSWYDHALETKQDGLPGIRYEDALYMVSEASACGRQ